MVNGYKKWLKYGAIVGLAPYSTVQHKQQWQRIYTVILLIINFHIAVYAIIALPLVGKQIISNFVSVLVYLTQCSVLTIILTEVLFTYKQYFQYMTQTQRVKELFRRYCGISICWRTMGHRRLRKKYQYYSTIVFGGIVCAILVITFGQYYGYFWFALPAILIIRTRCLQIIFHMDYLLHYTEMLNMKLRSVVSCKVQKQRYYLDVNYESLDSLEYLINLKEIHLNIHQLSLLYNDLFGWSTVGVCTGIFFDVIVNSFWAFLTLSHVFEYYFLFLNGSTILSLITMLSMLSYTGELLGKRQYYHSVRLVQRLQTTAAIKSIERNHSSVYMDLVAEFSMQIMQNPIRANAKGFFSLDLIFLMEIFAAVLTYLIILIQFHGSESES